MQATWNATIDQMKNEIARDILRWKDEDEGKADKQATMTAAPPGGDGKDDGKDKPADNGPGMDEGKPSVGGSIFAKFGVANAKTMQNNGQVLEEPLHPAVEQAPGSIPVAILRQLKKVEELPQANKTKVTERCVKTTLKMFRKAELEKAMKGDSAMIVRLREKVANVLMPMY